MFVKNLAAEMYSGNTTNYQKSSKAMSRLTDLKDSYLNFFMLSIDLSTAMYQFDMTGGT